MSETKHAPPVPQSFRESIISSAKNLESAPAEAPLTLHPTTESKESTTPISTLEARVLDNSDSMADEGEIIEQAPIIESVNKIKNEEAKKATEQITNEAKVDDFEFDEDTTNYLKAVYKEESKDASEKEISKGSKREPKEIEEEYKPYVAKAAEYDAFIGDPLNQAWFEFRKNGGTNPSDFSKKTGIVDVKSMTPEQLMEIDMKNTGLTPDEMAEEMDRFKEMTPYAQKKATKSIQDELERQNDEKLKTFTGASQESEKVVREAISRGTQELNSVLPKMEGKKYKGLLITSEMSNRIKQDVMDYPVPMHDKNGQFIGFNIEESIRRAVILNYDEQRSKALIELGKTMGADKALKSRIRPDKKETGTAVIPITQSTLESAGKNVSEKVWKQRGVKN